ncbi:hypothetical protein VP01_1826g6 [Puccinia sorghi]|uniref:Uncharacterized protein n=1 Tax=Puccinia sorghi TaxID=27349 RepID=A0A0L6VFU2_9BASI|nr:hypothetical protein VP01_1826g6 [Puccinia sorghi]
MSSHSSSQNLNTQINHTVDLLDANKTMYRLPLLHVIGQTATNKKF